MKDSQQLLSDYAQSGSEMAFRELVARYIDLVYSTAFRLVEGDSHRAQDVAQVVFIDLATQADKLRRDTLLGGWLHRHTCFVAAKVMRAERRRQVRERQTAEMSALNTEETQFAEIAPLLDEAINQLGEEDRKAILLRFFERQDLRSVGEALGSSENAAQKRVSRALDQLHLLLTRQTGAIPAATLGTFLATGAITAAPAGLAVSIAGACLSTMAGTGGGTLGLLQAAGITKFKITALSALAVVTLSTALFVQHYSKARLHEENRSLRQQLVQDADLKEENQRLSVLLAQATSRQAQAQEQWHELLRLRGEVGRLRQSNQELEKFRQENRQARVGQVQVAPTVEKASPLVLHARFYQMDNETLVSKLMSDAGTADGNSSAAALQDALRQFLKDNGIEIEPPATAYVDATNRMLTVRGSLETLDKVERLLQSSGNAYQKASSKDAGMSFPRKSVIIR